MTSKSGDHRAIRSVLVAIDDASAGHDTMEAAVNLAADLEAELQGLYIEDANLLRIADLPFVFEITTASATVRPIDAESMRRAMQQKADQVRRAMEDRAESARIRFSFSVTRGRALQRVRLATADTDIVFFGCRSHTPAVRPPAGLRPKGAARAVLVVLDDTPHSARGLDTAIAVAQKHARPVVILLLASERQALRQLTAEAFERSRSAEIQVTLLPQPISTLATLIQAARTQRPELLIVSRECPLLSDDAIESLIDELDCSVVLA
jgi:nucleotide-binding universal stress UspA family protein